MCDMLSVNNESWGLQTILKLYRNFPLPIENGVFAEETVFDCRNSAFLQLAGQLQTGYGHNLQILDLAETFMEEVEVKKHATQSARPSGNPLFVRLRDYEVANSLQ